MKSLSIVPPRPRSRKRPQPSLLTDPGDVQVAERLSRTFRALGDPTRSRMVLVLSRGESCVTDLARAIGLSLSATSHQLRVLRDLDLVRVRRAGKRQLYVLNERGFGLCSPATCQAWRLVRGPGIT